MTNADEIAELAGDDGSIGGEDGAERHPSRNSSGGPDAVRVIDALSARVARSVGELAVSTGMSPREVIATLGSLDLEGTVRESAGSWLKLRG